MTVKRMLPDPDNPGHQAEAVVVRVAEATEPFSYIMLEDGTTLTMRTTILEVSRFRNRWDKNNNPVYNITSQGSLSVAAPEELKKSAQSNDS